MSKIHILPKEVAMQIAAGEVIERPSSVLKELIENSIDANATEIDVYIESGGKKRICVEDNGIGMDEEDIKKCFLEHATSKIKNISDIYNINTFGFRGEALSAISAVSRLIICSKTNDAKIGTCIEVEDNSIKNIFNVAKNVGTKVEVNDLFYNVPARLAYMKSDTTEYAHCIKVFLSFVLYYNNIGWKLFSNNKLIYDFNVTTLKNRLSIVFDKDIEKKFIEINFDQDNIKGILFVPNIDNLYTKKGDQYIYVNNRFVSDKVITNAIYDAYKNILANPNIKDIPFITIIHLSDVDVNVHPRKLEVKFKDPKLIFNTINNVVKNSLKEKSYIKDDIITLSENIISNQYLLKNNSNVSLDSTNTIESNLDYSINFKVKNDEGINNNLINVDKCQNNQINNEITNQDFLKEIIKTENVSNKYNYMIFKNSFLILEQKDFLRIIDLHALHERILYEELISNFEKNNKKQYLIIPYLISLNAKDAQILKSNIDIFDKIGFDITDIGNNNFEISSIPNILTKLSDIQGVISLVLQDIESESYNIKNELPQYIRICKYMACRGAFMFGENIKENEIEYLLSKIPLLDNNITCPHGRPIYFDIPYNDILKKVGR